jgi:hypothetical protein
MNTASEPPKLVELRAKTDRQLLEMIGTRVNTGAACLRSAADASLRGCRATADFLSEKARKDHDEATLLLACVRGISKPERRALEQKLEDLLESIEDLLANGVRVRAAS